MQISVRSHRTAGVAAVVGASAIALAPTLPSTALQAVELPAPAVAEIALAGTSLPLEQIWTLLQTMGTGTALGAGDFPGALQTLTGGLSAAIRPTDPPASAPSAASALPGGAAAVHADVADEPGKPVARQRGASGASPAAAQRPGR